MKEKMLKNQAVKLNELSQKIWEQESIIYEKERVIEVLRLKNKDQSEEIINQKNQISDQAARIKEQNTQNR